LKNYLYKDKEILDLSSEVYSEKSWRSQIYSSQPNISNVNHKYVVFSGWQWSRQNICFLNAALLDESGISVMHGWG